MHNPEKPTVPRESFQDLQVALRHDTNVDPVVSHLNSTEAARRSLDDFMVFQYGDLGKTSDLAYNSEIIDGNFCRRVVSAYTDHGKLLLIRSKPSGPSHRATPGDYYAVQHDLRTGESNRPYVAGIVSTDALGPSGNQPGGSRRLQLLQPAERLVPNLKAWILSPHYDEDLLAGPRFDSGNALMDKLDEADFKLMHRDQIAKLPTVVQVGKMKAGYFRSGGGFEEILGSVPELFEAMKRFNHRYGAAAVASEVSVKADQYQQELQPAFRT